MGQHLRYQPVEGERLIDHPDVMPAFGALKEQGVLRVVRLDHRFLMPVRAYDYLSCVMRPGDSLGLHDTQREVACELIGAGLRNELVVPLGSSHSLFLSLWPARALSLSSSVRTPSAKSPNLSVSLVIASVFFIICWVLSAVA